VNNLFRDISGTGTGGAINAEVNNSLVFNNNSFTNCSSQGDAGAVWFSFLNSRNTQIQLTNSVFTQSLSMMSAGGMMLQEVQNVELTLQNVSFYQCDSRNLAGSLLIAGAGQTTSNVTVKNSNFFDCFLKFHRRMDDAYKVSFGGCVYTSGLQSLNVENAEFKNGYAGDIGSGHFIFASARSGSLNITDSRFRNGLTSFIIDEV